MPIRIAIRFLTLFNALVLSVVSMNSSAAVLTVTTLSDGLASCTVASCTLRSALNASSPGDTIQWASNLTFPATSVVANELPITHGLTIRGPGANKLSLESSIGRVFNIGNNITPNFSVEMSDLTIKFGSISGIAGESVDGGCIQSQATGTLTLRRIAFEFCQLIAGAGNDGTSGISGTEPGDPGQPGGEGGFGGDARGGAIFHAGITSLNQVSFKSVVAAAGRGGNGGDGGDAFSDSTPADGGSGGNGGGGGTVMGGVVFSEGALEMVNVSITNSGASAGDGGNGGLDGLDNEGNSNSGGFGGDGGSAYGGAIHSNGSSKISFSTLAINDTNHGNGGTDLFAGGSDGTTNGVVIHQQNAVASALTLQHSLVSAQTLLIGTVLCDGPITTVSSRSLTTCATATVGELDLLPAVTADNGILVLPLAVNSAAINAASSCLDANNTTVNIDARGAPRPFGGNCDLGAFEYDGVIFKNGFE